MARKPRKATSDDELEIIINIDADVASMRKTMERLIQDATNARSSDVQIELISELFGPDADNLQWQWVAMLDGDVCPECEELDGEIFGPDDDQPPLHPRCRCNITPIIDEETMRDIIDNLA